jgi:hypothetical protein
MRGFQNMSLEDRVAALEAQMVETLRLAGEARLLASGAHEESGTVAAALGAHGRLINGWGDQFNARIDTLDNRVGSVERRLGGLDSRMEAFDQRMGGLDSRMEGLGQRMGGLESRVDGLATEVREGFAHLVRLIQGQSDQDQG